MYSREEASAIRRKFWTTFGQYLSPHLSAEGLKVNWINYRTGLKHVLFKMDNVDKSAYIGIELHHPDEGIQELFFEQFLELKTYFHSVMEEEWIWLPLKLDDESDKTFSRIYLTEPNLNVMKEADWPKLIQFLKPRIIKLDEFWADAKYSFDALK
ncbi:DUF4268 domain-containing protein [Fulvivirga sp.]|uniref:DUF4268 domain-containing protein n=1 Tax=Fulvivirga sp. TaxID=1931237 RepID=UPI0032ED2948